MQPAPERKKFARLNSSKGDDAILQMFSEYVYVTAQQAIQILGRKRDYTYLRLRRLMQEGYLDRQQNGVFSEWVYFFTEKGGELAASRGHLESPKWIAKKSPMTLEHDKTITDFHMRLAHHVAIHIWEQWRGDLSKQFGEWIPDSHFLLVNEGWFVLEIVKSAESGYKKGESSLVSKLKDYEAEKRKVLVVMPTVQRVQNFIGKIQDELPSTRIWFTSEDRYKENILGSIWWAPANYGERTYSLLKP